MKFDIAVFIKKNCKEILKSHFPIEIKVFSSTLGLAGPSSAYEKWSGHETLKTSAKGTIWGEHERGYALRGSRDLPRRDGF